MSQPGDDAQRDLEQRALRNVRGLLDKIEGQDREDKRTTLRLALACGAVAIVGIAVLVILANRQPVPPNAVPLPPPASAAR